jgi:hypothetical protein
MIQSATRTRRLTQISERRRRISEEHHPESGDHGVIGLRREVVRRCVADDPLDLGSRDALSGGVDHWRRNVDAGH